ncbi:MAG: geranylgeranyl reductase family protein [Burkholderiales bacterium]
MSNTIATDVLVLGLGPAGACAARQAAEQGCRVIAVDRKRVAGRPVQCAEFVPAMIGMDVADLSASIAQPIRSMVTTIEDERPDVHSNFPGQMLDRAAFDAALVRRAVAAGAECRLGSMVRALTPEGIVVLADGTRIAAQVLIGADGPRSLAGRAIGAMNTAQVETRQLTVPLNAAYEATDIFLAAGIVGGYGWVFPKGHLANLGAGVDPAQRGRLKDIVANLHHELVMSGRVGAAILGLTGGLIPVGGMLKPWGMLGTRLVLLAGDAAGLTNPVTGAGITAAVTSGKIAGEWAASHLAGAAAAGADYEEEIASLYKVALDRAVARRAELAKAYRLGGAPSPAALRRGWIAYPEYWKRPINQPSERHHELLST